MDDWKLNTAPVLRLETPSKRFAHCVSAQCLLGLRGRSAPQSIRPGRSAPRPPHIHVFKGVTLRCGHRGFGLRLQFSLCYAMLNAVVPPRVQGRSAPGTGWFRPGYRVVPPRCKSSVLPHVYICLLGDWKQSKLCIFSDYVTCLTTFHSDNCEFVSNIHAAMQSRNFD